MPVMSEAKAWHSQAYYYLQVAYKFLENELPSNMLKGFDLGSVKLIFMDAPLREGSFYYKPDENKIIVPKSVEVDKIKSVEERVISLFVHELAHAIFQNYVNEKSKEQGGKGIFITSDRELSLLSEGMSYLFEHLYLITSERFYVSKGDQIEGLKNAIHLDRAYFYENSKLPTANYLERNSPIFKILKDALRDVVQSLKETRSVLNGLGISPNYPSNLEQLSAAEFILGIYEKGNFGSLGEAVAWVIVNKDQVVKQLHQDFESSLRK